MTKVVDILSAIIRDGQLKTGNKLPTESKIMVRFDVSHTVVGEAISRLQASGVVETRHGIGTFVIDPPEAGNFRVAQADVATVADVIAVLKLLISLEIEAAGLAALRSTGAQLQAIRKHLPGDPHPGCRRRPRRHARPPAKQQGTPVAMAGTLDGSGV